MREREKRKTDSYRWLSLALVILCPDRSCFLPLSWDVHTSKISNFTQFNVKLAAGSSRIHLTFLDVLKLSWDSHFTISIHVCLSNSIYQEPQKSSAGSRQKCKSCCSCFTDFLKGSFCATSLSLSRKDSWPKGWIPSETIRRPTNYRACVGSRRTGATCRIERRQLVRRTTRKKEHFEGKTPLKCAMHHGYELCRKCFWHWFLNGQRQNRNVGSEMSRLLEPAPVAEGSSL